MCWQREGRRVELATAKAMERARDSVNADGNDVYVGCKDARGDTHTHGGNGISRSFRKGVPKMIWAGKGEAASEGGRGEGSRWPRIHHDAWFTYLAGSRRGTQSANTDKMKLVRRTIRPSPLSFSSSSALSALLLLSCICIQTVCPLPFSSHRTHVEENRLGEFDEAGKGASEERLSTKVSL